MFVYQTPEFGSCVLLQLMKYTLKSRHLITLKACRAKWKITVRKAEMLNNLHIIVNGNIPEVVQRLSVCYFSFCEIDSLNSLSAEMDLFAFSNHRGKSNKLHTNRLQLWSLHAIRRAHAFLANSSIKTTSVLPSYLILKSRHLYGFCLWRSNPSVSLHDGKFLNVCISELQETSWMVTSHTPICCCYTWRDDSQAYRNPPFQMVFGPPGFQKTSELKGIKFTVEKLTWKFWNWHSRLLRTFILGVKTLKYVFGSWTA